MTFKNIPSTNKYRRAHTLLLIVLLLTAGFLVYANSFNSAMVLDDHQFIINDYAIHMTEISWDEIKTAAIEGHPRHRYLPNISFAVNYYFNQLNPVGYHIVNLAIHLLTGIFLFAFIRNTLKIYPDKNAGITPELIAFFAALLWIVQPVGSQAVTYICQRMASMVAMFYILSLLFYVKARMAMTQKRSQFLVPGLYFASCAIAALCAMATKENAGTLPLIILLYEWFFFQDLKLRWSRRQLIWAGFSVIVFGAAIFWYMGENPLNRIFNSYNIRDFTLIERIMTEFRIIIYYISLFLWSPPGRLNLDHDYPLSVSFFNPDTTLPAMAAIITLLAVAIYSAKKHRLFAFAILWFFITQATESTVIGIELIFEHRTYIPFMLVSLMLVMVVSRLLIPRRDRVYPRPIREGVKPSPTTADPNGSHPLSFFNKMSPCLLLCAVTILFSVWTFQRNLDWQNPVTFWHDSTVKSPTKWRPNYNLAKTLYDTGDIDGAFVQYEKTVLLHPTHVHSLNNLANILVQRGDIDGAIRNLHRSLEIAPDETTARVNLGNALVKKGMIGEAVVQYQLALRQNPNQKEIYMNLGMALAQGKKWEAAMDIYGRGVTLFPDYPGIRLELANAMAQSGKAVDAIYHYEILSTIPRIAPLAVKNKNTVLATLPSDDQVRTLFKTALLFTAEKNFDPAIGLLQEASVLTPDNAMIYYNIACLYALNNNKKNAVDWLHLAVEKGYDDWNHLKTDPDMNNIRNEPAFQRMIEKY